MSAPPITTVPATVWRVGNRRYLTRRAAERAVVKNAVRDYARSLGEHYGELFDDRQYAELRDWLLPQVRLGLSIDATAIDLFINPPLAGSGGGNAR